MGKESSQGFIDKVRSAIARKNSWLCCGLDPDPKRLPKMYNYRDRGDEAVIAFVRDVVEVTRGYVSAYKIQRAYFDLLTNPKKSLASIVEHVRDAAQVPVILDAKIGETESSMRAYMEFCERHLKVDGVVVNPYMGAEVLEVFRRNPASGGLVLVRTSNPGAGMLQDQKLMNGMLVWEFFLKTVVDEYELGSDVIPILASTAGLQSSNMLAGVPHDLPVFVAGYGAQGGSLDLINSLRSRGQRFVLVNSSRDIIFAFEREPNREWQSCVADAAERTRDAIAAAR